MKKTTATAGETAAGHAATGESTRTARAHAAGTAAAHTALHTTLHFSFFSATVLTVSLQLILVEDALELILVVLAGLLALLHFLLHIAHLVHHLLHEFLTLLVAHGTEVDALAVLIGHAHPLGREVHLVGILEVDGAHGLFLFGGQGVLLNHFLGALDNPDAVRNGLRHGGTIAVRSSTLCGQGNSAQHSR